MPRRHALVGCSYDCCDGVHRGLAATYLADERSTGHDDRGQPGPAQHVHDVVRANAEAVASGR